MFFNGTENASEADDSVRSATLEEQIDHVPTPLVSEGKPRLRFVPGPFSFIFCLANAIIFTAAISGYLKGQQSYSDLIGGSLAWRNADKGFDFRVFHVFLATFALLFAAIHLLGRRLQRAGSIQSVVEYALSLALIPVALWFGSRLPTNSFGNVPLESLFCGAAVLVLLFGVSRPFLAVTAESGKSVINTSLLTLVFGFFGGLGVITTLSRVVHLELSKSASVVSVTIICAFCFVASLLVILFSATITQIEERLRRVLFGSQLLLPLLWTIVIPPAIVENGHRILPTNSISLLAFVIVAAVICWLALFRHWRVRWLSERPELSLVPWAIVPIAIFLAVDHTVYPTFFGDDFHTGEHLLPWQQWHDFGKLPFVGFIPVHPLMDFFVSGVNSLFFDGTLANYANSRTILFAVAAALTFLSVARFSNVPFALCLAVAANVWDRLLLVPAILVVLCSGQLLNKARSWFICWIFICPLAVLYNPAAGIALTLASVPVAIVQIRQLLREDGKILLGSVLLCLAAVIALLLIPSTRAIWLGFAHFLLENGRSVTFVHGIEWQSDKTQMLSVRGILTAPLVWEIFRFSWILALVIAAAVFVSQASDWKRAHREALAASAMGCLFLLFLSGWTINRIDALGPSRSGEVSYLACLFIVPLIFFNAGRWRNVSSVVLFSAIGFFQSGMADYINSGSRPHSSLTMSRLLEKPVTALTVPSQCFSIEGASFGLPNLGHIYVRKQIFEPLIGLNATLHDLLKPGETYLDLTGRLANYFYLGMPVATSCGAPWLAASTVLQDDLLAELKLHPAPVVWIGPAINRAAEGPSVRTYKLYRFLVKNYVPYFRSGCLFLVAPDRIDQTGLSADKRLDLFRLAFENENIGSISPAWGRSWDLLENRFTPIEKLSVTEQRISDGAGIALTSGKQSLDGTKGDFIRFDFLSNLAPKAAVEIEITWNSEYGTGAARLHVANGTNLVPIGLFPGWLIAKSISDVKLQPRSVTPGLTYLISNPELLRLKD